MRPGSLWWKESMALKRCVISLAPDRTASSPCSRVDTECPTDTATPREDSAFITFDI